MSNLTGSSSKMNWYSITLQDRVGRNTKNASFLIILFKSLYIGLFSCSFNICPSKINILKNEYICYLSSVSRLLKMFQFDSHKLNQHTSFQSEIFNS